MAKLKYAKIIRVEDWANRHSIAAEIMSRDESIQIVTPHADEGIAVCRKVKHRHCIVHMHHNIMNMEIVEHGDERYHSGITYLLMGLDKAEELLPHIDGHVIILADANQVYRSEKEALTIASVVAHMKKMASELVKRQLEPDQDFEAAVHVTVKPKVVPKVEEVHVNIHRAEKPAESKASPIAEPFRDEVFISPGDDGDPAIHFGPMDSKRNAPLIVAAPRQCGKTMAILERLRDDPRAIMVVDTHMRMERLTKAHPDIAKQVYTVRDVFNKRMPSRDRELYVDDFDDAWIEIMECLGYSVTACTMTIDETEPRPVLVTREDLDPGTSSTLAWYPYPKQAPTPGKAVFVIRVKAGKSYVAHDAEAYDGAGFQERRGSKVIAWAYKPMVPAKYSTD